MLNLRSRFEYLDAGNEPDKLARSCGTHVGLNQIVIGVNLDIAVAGSFSFRVNAEQS